MQLKTMRVFVDNMAAAKAFYAAKLGLSLKADGAPHGYCIFDAGSTALILESVPVDAPEEERMLVGRFTGLSFTVTDIQSKYAQLLANEVPFSEAPERQYWGGTLATFSDPAGNQLQLVEQP